MITERANQQIQAANDQNNTDIGHWCLDMVNNRLYWSDETYRIFGVAKEGFLPYYSTFYNAIHRDDRAALTAHRNLFLKGVIPMNIEHRIVLPSGEIRHVHQSGERIFDLTNRLIWLRGTIEDVTDRRIMSNELENLSPITSKTSNTMMFIATDYLSLKQWPGPRSAVRKQYISSIMACRTNLYNLLVKSVSLVSSVTAGLMRLSKLITAGGADDLHLNSAIETLINQITAAKPMTISFDTGMFYEKGLSKKVKLNIFRVTQEQFSNIAKYAYASEVYVSLHRTRQKVYLTIDDNGKGLDMSKKSNGICITDMAKCAEVNNGQATIKSEPGMGCHLTAEFPIH